MEAVLGWQAPRRASADVGLGSALPERERGIESVKERASVGEV
jgi:hypothetical protein